MSEPLITVQNDITARYHALAEQFFERFENTYISLLHFTKATSVGRCGETYW